MTKDAQVGKTFDIVNNTTYKIARTFEGGERIVLEIPGRGSPTAWYARSEQDLINVASQQAESSDWSYNTYDVASIKAVFGDKAPEAVEIATRHGKALLRNDTWLAPLDPSASEYEWAIAYLEHDLHSLHVFESMQECYDFNENYVGHSCFAAEVALLRCLADNGFLGKDEED